MCYDFIPMSTPIISVENIAKRYRTGEHHRPMCRSIKEEVTHILSRCCGRHIPQPSREFWALRDVSFDVQKGEIIGVIGRNGAGKSTLIRILAGVTRPTAGQVTLRGTVGTLIGTGLGMHPELNGRENIVLSGGIMGLQKREIEDRLEEILAFSELESFADTPVKYYSNGMHARLSFSVSIYLNRPEILLIDEVLAAGDIAFKQKCFTKLLECVNEGTTIVLVTHAVDYVRQLADRCIYLKNGEINCIGDPATVAGKYLQDAQKPSAILQNA